MRFTVAWLMQRRIAKTQNIEHGRICRAERGLALFVQRRVAKRQNVEHNAGEVKTQRWISRAEVRKDIIIDINNQKPNIP